MIRIMRPVIAALVALPLFAETCFAVEPGELLPNPADEARARSLSAELRCLVCQNQSIDESDAELARDLRTLVRQRVVAGDSNDAIKAFLVARFGEFVLLKPPVNGHTWLLWSLPFIALGLGAFGAIRLSRRRSVTPGAELSTDEQARLNGLLKDHG